MSQIRKSGDWRDAERALFCALNALLAGHQPASALADVDARRSGYLAEFAALLLSAPHRLALLNWAERRHAMLERQLGPAASWPVVAAVSGGAARAPTGLDDLAARWRISPGLDAARFFAERPSLPSP